MRIDGKVASILSDYEVAFNIGSDQGVETDDIVTVYRIIDVEDPDTKEFIGSVLTPRMRFKITLVQPRMSVGQSYESIMNPQDEGSFTTSLIVKSVIKRVTTIRHQEDWRNIFLEVGDPAVIQAERQSPTKEEQSRADSQGSEKEAQEEDEGSGNPSSASES
jgi:hypothetical protein